MGSCVGRPLGRSRNDASYSRMPVNDPSVDPPPPYEFEPAPATFQQRAQQQMLAMSDEERFQYARRLTLLQLLPVGTYDHNKEEKQRECVICFAEFAVGDAIRLLPCMHLYHQKCIDDWLERSFSCPICGGDLDDVLSSFVSPQLPEEPDQ